MAQRKADEDNAAAAASGPPMREKIVDEPAKVDRESGAVADPRPEESRRDIRRDTPDEQAQANETEAAVLRGNAAKGPSTLIDLPGDGSGPRVMTDTGKGYLEDVPPPERAAIATTGEQRVVVRNGQMAIEPVVRSVDPEDRPDEAPRGGRYIVGGLLVDAEGRQVKDED